MSLVYKRLRQDLHTALLLKIGSLFHRSLSRPWLNTFVADVLCLMTVALVSSAHWPKHTLFLVKHAHACINI